MFTNNWHSTHPSCPYTLSLANAAVMAPTTPPRRPGMACKLWMPQVSWIFKYFSINGYIEKQNQTYLDLDVSFLCFTTQMHLISLNTHREHHISESGQDPAAESNYQRAVCCDHKLGCSSHGDSSSQGGILDMHLQAYMLCLRKHMHCKFVGVDIMRRRDLPCPAFPSWLKD